MKKLLIASNNQGKIKEIKDYFSNLNLDILSPKDFPNLPQDVEETGKTFKENAILKAKTLGQASGLITLADDSGIVVDALDGKPGVYSARFGPSSQARNKKLIQKLKIIKQNNRTARFVCAICIYDPIQKKTRCCQGIAEGKITHHLRGKHGFGYDPIFLSDELDKTFAEASIEEKNDISHRGRALKRAKVILKEMIKDLKA